MKKRLVVLIMIIPFLVLDCIALPIILVYWLLTGKFTEPLLYQLITSLDDDK